MVYRFIKVGFLWLACAGMLGACTTSAPPGYYTGGYHGVPGNGPVSGQTGNTDHQLYNGNGIAVLGIVATSYDLHSFRQNNLAAMLESQMRRQQPVNGVVPYNEVRKSLSRRNGHKVLLQRFKHNGKLTQSDLQFLKSAAMPARYLVVARIDRNDTTRYRPVKSALKNHNGDALSDKQKITLLHQRTVQVSARAYDIESGRETWSGSFISQPISRRSYTEYTGSSITGAMATRFANSFVNGRSGKKYPPAPRASDSMRETFKSIAKALSGNTYARL